ncbi:hypothetical protein HYDPIDRAFT_134842 [Hydnomerulius pinastri MD-312]|uniref:F-box domain-containing protein n=1 Tax=Hydnomerulius pinastri MD-312 TaxID=994086 RepID=A0A0C9VXU3_9AGAM|nr:hypothetical protein HYDPIDRAFT_134842 [Hydnomerulius pinastri MD-312]
MARTHTSGQLSDLNSASANEKPMHRCLRITEVLATIFTRVQDKRTLACLARTCRLFQDVALNALYEEIDHLRDLVRCMGNGGVVGGGQLHFRQPIEPKHLAVLKSYSARVRRLTVSEDPPVLHESIVHALCMVRTESPNGALTPNLRSLRWETRDVRGKYSVLLPVFISRGLTHLTIPDSLDNRHSGFHLVTSLCPALESFSVIPDDVHHRTVELPFIGEWKHLRSVSCGVLSHKAFNRATACSLQSFAFKLPFDVDASIDRLWLGPQSFRALGTLAIDAPSLGPIAEMLVKMTLPSLTALLVSTRLVMEVELVSLVDVLRRKAPQALRRLSLWYSLSNGDFHKEWGPYHGISVLEHLHDFPTLTSISINACSFALDDITLETLAKALPNLETLEMMASTPRIPPKITLGGLVPLLRHCPRLGVLKLSVDATHVTHTTDRPGGGVCNTIITELMLSNSPVRDAGRVAAFISDVMPCVREIRANSMGEKWCEVAGLVGVIAMARRQERRWCVRNVS